MKVEPLGRAGWGWSAASRGRGGGGDTGGLGELAAGPQWCGRWWRSTNECPWGLAAGHVDEWMTHEIFERRLGESTILIYQGSIRLFCDYLTSPVYD